MVFGETEGCGDVVCHFLTVTSEHDGAGNTEGLQGGDGLSTVGLDLVIDDDMTRIFPINGYMDDGTHMMAVVPLGTDGIHHLRVSYADNLIPYPCTDAVTSDLLDIRNRTAVRRLIREGITQGGTDGMGGKVLNVSGEMQELMLIARIRVYRFDGELTMGEGAGFVEDNGIDLRKDIHVVRTLDEDTLAGSTTDATEEGKGHADNEGTGTTHHQEHQSPV